MELPARPDLPLALRGYSPSAVDQHLDLLEAAIDDLLTRLQLLRSERDRLQDALRAQEQLDSMETSGGTSSGPAEPPVPDSGLEAMTRSIAAVLRGAHQEAAAVHSRAEVTAAALIEEAQQRATALVKEAEEWAAALVEEAEQRAAALAEEDSPTGLAGPALNGTASSSLDPGAGTVRDDRMEARRHDPVAIASTVAVPSRPWEA